MLVLDKIEILPPLEKYKYDTWTILLVKCYIDNSVHLRRYIRNINNYHVCCWYYAQQVSLWWICGPNSSAVAHVRTATSPSSASRRGACNTHFLQE
jgi:hypothetical protein